MTTRDFVALVRAYVRQAPIAPSTLAVKAGLNSGTLRNLHKPGWSPRIETQEALMKVIPADFAPSKDTEAA